MDILIVPASLDLLHQWKGTRIPNNRVLAIGGAAWVKAILKIATQGKEALGQRCDHMHEHQGIRGMNRFGDRRAKKAEWPPKMCKEPLKAVEKERDNLICAVAFPMESKALEDLEPGPLDDADGDDGCQEVFGKSMSDRADQEQEMSDSIEFVGSPNEEGARRRVWAQLPRVVRASIRRPQKIFTHKSASIMLQVLQETEQTQRS